MNVGPLGLPWRGSHLCSSWWLPDGNIGSVLPDLLTVQEKLETDLTLSEIVQFLNFGIKFQLKMKLPLGSVVTPTYHMLGLVCRLSFSVSMLVWPVSSWGSGGGTQL